MSGIPTRGAYWYAGGVDRININCETGLVKIIAGLETPVVATNEILGSTAEQITIRDNVVITGNLECQGAVTSIMRRYQDSPEDIDNEYLTVAKLQTGLLIQDNMNAIRAFLPTGSSVYNSLLGFNSSIDWTVICSGVNVGSCTIDTNANHAVVGNMYVAAGTSGMFRTRLFSTTNAITYRIA